MDLAFVDKLAKQNIGVNNLLNAVDVFPRFIRGQARKKNAKDTLHAFKKMISQKTLLKNFGLIKEQNMREHSKTFARRKTLKFSQQ